MRMWMSYDDEETWDEVKSIKDMLDIGFKNNNREFILKFQDSDDVFITMSSDDVYATYNKKENDNSWLDTS